MYTDLNNTNGEDLLNIETNFVRASGGKRFVNYLIDVLVFYVIMFIVGILLALSSPDAADSYVQNDSGGFAFGERVLALILYAVYMGLIETIFKGKSLGKLVTGTRAVNLDGSKINSGKAFGRAFSRAVPFCVFSAFGDPCNPWQDRWTDTMVIDEKLSTQS